MRRHNPDWLDWLPWLFGGAAVGGAIWAATRMSSDEAEGDAESDAPPLEQILDHREFDRHVVNAQVAQATKEAQMPTLDAGVLARAPVYESAINVIAKIAIGDTSVFATKFKQRQLVFDNRLRGLTDPQVGRKVIVLQTYEDVRFFGTLMSIGWMLSQGDRKAKTLSDVILNWMYYHRWEVAPQLQAQVISQLLAHSCKEDTRLPYYQKGAYPEIFQPNPINAAGTPIEVGGNEAVWPAFVQQNTYTVRTQRDLATFGYCHDQDKLSTDEKEALAAKALNKGADRSFFNWPFGKSIYPKIGPPGLLVEYAMARYMQFSLVALIDPKAGEAVGQNLMKALDTALGIAASAGGVAITAAFTAGATSTVPVAGWITSAIAGLVALFAGLFGVGAMIDRTRKSRKTVCKQIANFLGMAWQKYGYSYPPKLTEYLSGYRADILIPRDSWNGTAHYDDIQNPLFNNFALVSSTTVNACPQLPFFYLNIDFPLPVSVDAVMNNWVTVDPIMQGGIVTDWKQGGYTMPDYAQAVAHYLKSNPILQKL